MVNEPPVTMSKYSLILGLAMALGVLAQGCGDSATNAAGTPTSSADAGNGLPVSPGDPSTDPFGEFGDEGENTDDEGGEDEGEEGDEGGETPVAGDAGVPSCDESGRAAINAVGPVAVDALEGSTQLLKVLVLREGCGPIAGTEVKFFALSPDEIGFPDGTSLVTDEKGFGALQAQIIKGNGPSQVEAVYEGADESVVFTFNIQTRALKIGIEGDTAIDAPVKTKVRVTARITDQKGKPAEGIPITLTLTGAGDAVADPPTASTGLNGSAQFVIDSGSQVTTYIGQFTAPKTQAAEITITVSQRGSSSSLCESDLNCTQGLICVGGQCIPKEENPGCQTDEDCPDGFACTAGEPDPDTGKVVNACTPASAGCTDNCVTGCVYDTDCPDDQFCNSGSCVTVPEDAPDRTPCTSSDQCPKGFTCAANGFCGGRTDDPLPGETTGGGFGDSPVDGGLPPGTDFDAGVPDGGGFGDSQLDGGTKPPGCVLDKDCSGANQFCNAGTCTAKPPPLALTPDVSGLWFTHHEFDMTDALFGFPKLAGPLDFINQTFKNGIKLPNIPIIGSILETMINDFIDQYIPPWLKDIIAALNTLANLLQTLIVEGEMVLRHENPDTIISGKEEWITALVYMIDQCPGGRKDPNFPSCAELDIGLGTANIAVKEVKPIAGSISGQTLNISRREVDFEIRKFIKYVVDLVVQLVTGYDTLEEMVVNLVDCQAVEDAINDLAADLGFGGSIPIKSTCEKVVKQAAGELGNLIAGIAIDWTTFKFEGYATIVDDGAQPPDRPYAEELVNGVWNGDIKIITSGKLRGKWHAER